MFLKRKKDVVKRHVVEKEPETYVIPQIPDDTIGLRPLGHRFEKTLAVSPMEGHYTKDVITVPSVEVKGDLDVLYDPFRVEKKLTVEDEIRKFGVANHEFPSVDTQLDPANYQKKPGDEKKKPDELGFNFGIVYEIDEISKPENDPIPEIPTRPNISFNETVVQKPVDVGFEPINVSNEIRSEQEEYIARPTPRVTEHMQVPPRVVDESIPKTIVLGKASTISRVEETPTINIPPFVTPITNIETPQQTEIIFEAPQVNVPTHNVYDSYRETQESKVIYSDKYANYKFPPVSLLNPVNKEVTEEPYWVQKKLILLTTHF